MGDTLRRGTIPIAPVDPESLPDDELVLRARQGETRAFDALYARYAREITAFVRSQMSSTPDAAEDVTSEIFTKVYRFLDRYQNGSFRGWLYQIARNAITDSYRRQRPVTPLAEDLQLESRGPTLDEQAIATEARERLEAALLTLAPTPRRILELRLKGYGLAEICAELGMELSAVKSAQHRAFRRLRAHLHDIVTDEGDPA